MPRTSSVSMGQSPSGVDRILEKQAKGDPLQKCKKRKFLNHWWTFQDYRMHRETECNRISRISIRYHL